MNASAAISEVSGVRNIALVGPYLSGKTTLLESVLYVTGAITRKGKVGEGNTVGDSSAEARDRGMTVEVNVASAVWQGMRLNFLDCPGSIEFLQETYNAAIGVDAAVVVCEPTHDRVNTLAPLFQFLDAWQIPHIVFVNKMDRACSGDACFAPAFQALLQALRGVSSRPLVPQQYPIGLGAELTGAVDLVTEQAYQYRRNDAPASIPIPPELLAQEREVRARMLETLADFDDRLLEELLEDIEPTREEIERDLQAELSHDQIVPVCFGVAEHDYGVRLLLNALVSEVPPPAIAAAQRLPEPCPRDRAIAQVLKTFYMPQGGKYSLVRLWQGELNDGAVLNGERIGGLYRPFGQQLQPIQHAEAGDIVAIGRLEEAATGDVLSDRAVADDLLPKVPVFPPVFALAVTPARRQDEVKLSSALAKLCEEDPALQWELHGDTHEAILWGQGEIHLQVALDRLRRKYNLPLATHLPQVPYRETVRKPAQSHGRYKHQTGGHGQFGDVYLEIQPLDRGEGFRFGETIVGGVVPRQYIPGVEMGVREALEKGPLGFPVVDVAVTLTNGSYHSVDSSEQAFKMAARLAMQEGMAKAQPILLEPISAVAISVPTEYTANVMRLVTGRRGQILGYEAKPDWQHWDCVSATIPQAEMHDLIVELRSLTMGVGFFEATFERLQEVPDKLAERILARKGNGANVNG